VPSADALTLQIPSDALVAILVGSEAWRPPRIDGLVQTGDGLIGLGEQLPPLAVGVPRLLWKGGAIRQMQPLTDEAVLID
jgi:hypothetical protein